MTRLSQFRAPHTTCLLRCANRSHTITRPTSGPLAAFSMSSAHCNMRFQERICSDSYSRLSKTNKDRSRICTLKTCKSWSTRCSPRTIKNGHRWLIFFACPSFSSTWWPSFKTKGVWVKISRLLRLETFSLLLSTSWSRRIKASLRLPIEWNYERSSEIWQSLSSSKKLRRLLTPTKHLASS